MDHELDALRFRAAVESSPAGVVMADGRGRIVLVNRQVERMFGYARGELIGQPVEILVPERLREVHAKDRRAFERDPRARAMGAGRELRGRRKDGTELPVEIGLNPVAAGGQTFVIASIVDISEREKLRRRLVMADRMASVGTLVAGVAHGINNPLAYVRANLSYVRDELSHVLEPLASAAAAAAARGELAEKLADLTSALDQALEGSTRIRDLVVDLVAFTRAGTQGRTPVSLPALLESVLNLAGGEIRRRARLETRFEPAPHVDANAPRLAHALLNLLVNAGQAIPEGDPDAHRVCVSTSTDSKGRAVVEVRDTGEGIAPERLDRLFVPFFTTRPVGEGVGLGLWQTHTEITALGGHIEVESARGEGTAFRIVLPAASRAEPERPQPGPSLGSG